MCVPLHIDISIEFIQAYGRIIHIYNFKCINYRHLRYFVSMYKEIANEIVSSGENREDLSNSMKLLKSKYEEEKITKV